MKATLRLKYPFFTAELVAFKDEAPSHDERTPLITHCFSGTAVLNLYSKYKQKVTATANIQVLNPSEALLVLKGKVEIEGKMYKALDLVNPAVTKRTIKGAPFVGLIIR